MSNWSTSRVTIFNDIKQMLIMSANLFLKKIAMPAKQVYILTSVAATLWFLIRVIPKPSRASYPCMQVAAPIMSGFIIWMLALSGAAFAFKKARSKIFEAKYLAAGLFIIMGIGSASSVYGTIGQRVECQ